MAQGKAKSTLLGIQGLVGHRNAPDWSFIYEASLTKSPKWFIGDRVVLPDGREFRYAKSGGACVSGQGVEVYSAGVMAYTSFVVAAAIGDKEVTVPAATHAAKTKDELRGGYLLIWNPAGSNSCQFRGIIGNDATAADVAFKVYLDGPLTEAVTTSSSAEVFENPFAAVRTGTMNYFAKVGIPAREISAANTYFWVQTRGCCFGAPQGGKLRTTEGGYVGGLWSDYGNISDYNTSLGVTVAGGRGSQHAGFAIQGDADNIGPLFMLQG